MSRESLDAPEDVPEQAPRQVALGQRSRTLARRVRYNGATAMQRSQDELTGDLSVSRTSPGLPKVLKTDREDWSISRIPDRLKGGIA